MALCALLVPALPAVAEDAADLILEHGVRREGAP